MYTVDLKFNKKNLPLNEIPVNIGYKENNKTNLLSFKEICKKIFEENKFVHDYLQVQKIKEDEDVDFFHGQLGLAEYGNERGLYDSENDIEKDPLQPSDKVLEPFFFMFAIPLKNNNDKGFLVIEKKKNKRIMSSFREMINEKIKEFNASLRIHFNPHNPIELEDVVNDGIVSEYYFSIYENDENNFEDKRLTKAKISLPFK